VAESSPEVRSVVITGEGATFCAGGNLQRLLANRQQPPEVQAQSIEGLHNWIEAIRTFPKPVIAAVEGAAAGAGFSLALACDLVVAPAQCGVCHGLQQRRPVARRRAAAGAWRKRPAAPAGHRNADVRRAHRRRAPACELGMVNRVADPGSPGTALTLAERLNARAPNALASIKELVNEAPCPLSAHLASERDHFVKNLHHVNGGIGISPFLDKQTPRYE
jgi:enoyl-CoA hydratase/carnithine racemase